MPFCSFKCVQIFSFFILITAHYYVTQLNLTSFYSSSIFLRMPKFPCHICFFSQARKQKALKMDKIILQVIPMPHLLTCQYTKLLLSCEIHSLFHFWKIARQSFVANSSFSSFNRIINKLQGNKIEILYK